MEDESSAYTFNVEPLAETVFGVYAAEDFNSGETLCSLSQLTSLTL